MIDFAASIPQPSFWAMLGGGLLAFVSPCVLPMLPVYALYLAGGNADDLGGRASWRQVLLRCLGLMASFVLLFTAMGAGAGLIGGALKNANRDVLDAVSGGLMILFGLWMLEVFRGKGLPWLARRRSQRNGAEPPKPPKPAPRLNGFFGAFAFGFLLVLSWTPCMTPLLANALVLAASQENATMAAGMAHLAVFALGLCLPMLLFMLLYQWLKGALLWLKTRQALIRRIGGGLMAAYGLYRVIAALL